MAANKIDWEKVETRYITSDLTLEQIAQEFDLSISTLKKKATQMKWSTKKKRRSKKRTKKCIEKVEDRVNKRVVKTITTSLESEASAVEKMLKIVHKALDDELQFNKHLVTMEYADENGKRKWVEEQVFSKLDLRNFNSLVSSLDKLEKLHRSLTGLVTTWQKSAIEVNLERLAIERERLEIAKAKELGVIDTTEVGVVMLPEVNLEAYQAEQALFMEQLEAKGEDHAE